MAADWTTINEEIRQCRGSADARRCLEELFARTNDGHVAFALGEETQRFGELETALAWFEVAERLYPKQHFQDRAREQADAVRTALDEVVVPSEPPSSNRIEEFRVLRRLGSGGFGDVYLATDEVIGRQVALKLLRVDSDEAEARFRREAAAAGGIQHPNVVGVYRAFRWGSTFVIAMEYVSGGDLGGMVAPGRPLAAETAVAIIEDVAAGLDIAHSRGLVHRDLKPGNILLRETPGRRQAVVTDFGLVKALDATTLTSAGYSAGGTIPFMAPEQVTGEEVSARTDVYALGTVFFVLLTGEIPFWRESVSAMMYARCQEEPPALREVLPTAPPALEAVILKAMSRDPAERFASAGEMARAARNALGAAPPPPGKGWARRADLDTQDFVYQWPSGPERFERLEAWSAPARLGGLYGLAKAVDTPKSFGRARSSFGVFRLDEKGRVVRHIASFSEDDSGGYVSLIRGQGGGRAAFQPDEPLPNGYEKLRVGTHSERVEGGYNRLAVIADEGNAEAMVTHAALQVVLRPNLQ